MNLLDEKALTIVLAGNANVGKSAIFNQLTGLCQETGNWPGKTVGFKEGKFSHHGIQINIVDLPGIYSFSTYSPEEQVTRAYILTRRPDIVINVLDATSLERNLYFCLQLKEMNVPLVVALNYSDIAKKKHIYLDSDLLGRILDAPVVNTVAIKGIGVHELVDVALRVRDKRNASQSLNSIKYGLEIENRINQIVHSLTARDRTDPERWTAIQLLEGDRETIEKYKIGNPGLIDLAHQLCLEIGGIHGEDCSLVITSERFATAARIAKQVNTVEGSKSGLTGRLDDISLHPVLGYLLLFGMMAFILLFISFFGGWLTNLISNFFNSLRPAISSPLVEVIWDGGVVGFYAAFSVAAGFILPFFLILSWLAESGYLPRIAFLMDRPCHSLGLHGQASLPLIMALGCNVPACLACRIMDNKRDRLVATFLSTLVPCSARTSVVLGLVGAFVGWQWAVTLLAFQFILIYFIGRFLNRLSKSSSPGILMEIPEFRLPSLKIVWSQAWYRFKDFLVIGLPLIVAGSMVIEILRIYNFLDYVTRALTPLTVFWLGLPAFTGVLLVLGILRKEATLALLISLAGGAQIASIITPLQMVVFSLVVMLYIPCISTIAVLFKETGLKLTVIMVIAEVVLALFIGGIAYRTLALFLN
jgi:ferrous iron transport protein B